MRLYRVESDTKFVEYAPEKFETGHKEKLLQTWLENNADAIVEDGRLMLIGREVTTNLGKSIDLLALDREGDAVIIELKRGETPRTTLAQALEYTAFAEELDHEALSAVYRAYLCDSERSLSETIAPISTWATKRPCRSTRNSAWSLSATRSRRKSAKRRPTCAARVCASLASSSTTSRPPAASSCSRLRSSSAWNR